MKDFLLMPENCRWYIVQANSAEMAYSSQCCWFINTKIAVMDMETHETFMFPKGVEL